MLSINLTKVVRFFLIAAIVLLAVNISPGSAMKLSLQTGLSPLVSPSDTGTAFTYQGRLLSGTSPANGVFDFKFSLYDTDYPGGSLVPPSPIIVPDILVTNGLFMADLDFGASAFNGFELWLEIQVKPDASATYTTLMPRQKINPTPYATFARTIYRKTVVVKPVTPTGTMLDNGQVLIDALSALSGAYTDDRYLVKIEPGLYNLGSSHLNMIPFVDIEGSGEGVTIIYADGNADDFSATVVGANDAEIRSLTLLALGMRPSGQKNYANAVYIPAGVSLKLNQVTLEAYNGLVATRGIYMDGGSTPYSTQAVLHNVTVAAEFNTGINPGDAPEVDGILLDGGSYLSANDSSIKAWGGKNTFGVNLLDATAYLEATKVDIESDYDDPLQICSGIHVNGPSATLTMRNSTANVYCHPPSSYHTYVQGIEGEGAGLIQLFDSAVSVTGGMKGYLTGILENGSSGLLALTNVKVDVYGDNVSNIGIYSDVAPFVIRDSFIYARDGELAVGLAVVESDSGAAPDGEVINSVIRAEAANSHDNPDPGLNNNIGIVFASDGRLKLMRDTIQVEPQNTGQDPIAQYGGVGIYAEHGKLIMENSTVNDSRDAAYLGIALKHDGDSGKVALINNSEIYSCWEDYCHTIAVNDGDATPPANTVVQISSTLLFGGPVNWAPPTINCLWVTDENYAGFGWPSMPFTDSGGDTGPVPASSVCP